MIYARLLVLVLLGVSVRGEADLKQRALQDGIGDPNDPGGDGMGGPGDGGPGDDPTGGPGDDPTGVETGMPSAPVAETEPPVTTPTVAPTFEDFEVTTPPAAPPVEVAATGDETNTPSGGETSMPFSGAETDTEMPTGTPEPTLSSAVSLKASAMLLVPAIAYFLLL